jgi:hypothetical protein
MLALVERIQRTGGKRADVELFVANCKHPAGTDLIFWPHGFPHDPSKPEPTAEEIVAKAMPDARITWFRGTRRAGPCQTIGVLEVEGDGSCRAVFAERSEVDGRAHIQLARRAWGPKSSLDTRWWSLVLDRKCDVHTVRTGSCGDPLNTADVPRVVRALEDLGLMNEKVMVVVDDGPSVFPWRGGAKASPLTTNA